MKMVKILLSLLLLAALTERVSALVREHFYVEGNIEWSEAQTYCRTYYKDLSTFSSEEEYSRFLDTTGYLLFGWIGLYQERGALKYKQWSDGNPVTYTLLTNTTTSYDQCVFVDSTGAWNVGDCSSIIGPMFCYRVPDLILVKQNKSWEDALEYCRLNYIDLASLTSLTDLQTAEKLVNSTTVKVWTSLRFLAGDWFWVNNETLDSQMSLPSCPISPNHCGARNFKTDSWDFQDCDKKLYFFCYT
ncbi:lymphocyte antigen 75-like [Paramisgurnus dabryanus]|uniref:lymphocyte antigen 75-like n=1 Tax=Paramisgurnus dabryanus TaxID=90735 RepID=UPI003CCFAAD1